MELVYLVSLFIQQGKGGWTKASLTLLENMKIWRKIQVIYVPLPTAFGDSKYSYLKLESNSCHNIFAFLLDGVEGENVYQP